MGKLGETLRERRVALGLTLEQAQEGTRIRGKLLDALESGDYDTLPNPGYVRGYISSYARFLELDPGPLLNMYKAESGAARYNELNLPQTTEAVLPTGEQHAMPWRAALGGVLLIALVALSVWAIVRLTREPQSPAPEPAPVAEQTETPSVAETLSPEPAEEESTTVDPPTKAPADAQPFTLEVQVADDAASWLRITVDGQPAYEGTLAGGQSKEYEVAEEATVRVGKPEAVTVLRDGEEVEIDTKGDVSTVTIKAEPTQ